MSARRTDAGGRIDRARSIRFSFDGRDFTGHPGDTLASALLATGVSSATAQGKRGKLASTGKKQGKKKGKGQANALCARQEQQCRDTFLPLCQGDIVCLGQLGCCEELATCDVLGFFICLAPQ